MKVEVEFKEAKQLVVSALTSMLSVCDGAHTEDGVGFNKPDAGKASWFMRLVDNNKVTTRELYAIRKMLKKYKGQLVSYGIDYDKMMSMRIMEKPEATAVLEEFYDDAGNSTGKRIVVKSTYNERYISQIKQLEPKDRAFNPEKKTWSFNPDVWEYLNIVTMDVFGLDISGMMYESGLVEKPEPPKPERVRDEYTFETACELVGHCEACRLIGDEGCEHHYTEDEHSEAIEMVKEAPCPFWESNVGYCPRCKTFHIGGCLDCSIDALHDDISPILPNTIEAKEWLVAHAEMLPKSIQDCEHREGRLGSTGINICPGNEPYSCERAIAEGRCHKGIYVIPKSGAYEVQDVRCADDRL